MYSICNFGQLEFLKYSSKSMLQKKMEKMDSCFYSDLVKVNFEKKDH